MHGNPGLSFLPFFMPSAVSASEKKQLLSSIRIADTCSHLFGGRRCMLRLPEKVQRSCRSWRPACRKLARKLKGGAQSAVACGRAQSSCEDSWLTAQKLWQPASLSWSSSNWRCCCLLHRKGAHSPSYTLADVHIGFKGSDVQRVVEPQRPAHSWGKSVCCSFCDQMCLPSGA